MILEIIPILWFLPQVNPPQMHELLNLRLKGNDHLILVEAGDVDLIIEALLLIHLLDQLKKYPQVVLISQIYQDMHQAMIMIVVLFQLNQRMINLYLDVVRLKEIQESLLLHS